MSQSVIAPDAATEAVLEAAAAIPVHPVAAPKPRPDERTLGFGRHFTDHMYRADYTKATGWTDARVEAHGPLSLDPAAAALHYAQAIFEGMKAFRGGDGRVRIFRLLDHARRFERSAAGLAMPPIPAAEMAAGIVAAVRADADWVPSGRGTALYIRPTMVATEGFLGVRPAEAYAAFVILSPVGPYYGGAGMKAIRLWVEQRRVRAAPGGIGAVKAAANYAASLGAGLEARQRGYDQVLWTDAITHRGIEEAGTMNVFVRIGDEVVTPPLGGTILPGVTRDSVLALLRRWGVRTSERAVTVDELREAHAKGILHEVFGCGTASVIAPVGTLGFESGDLTVGDGTPGPVAQRLYDAILGIQYGEGEDPEGWMTVVA